MKIAQYFSRFAAALLIWSFLHCGIAVSLPEHMLSPAIMINSPTFVQDMSRISEQPFIDPLASLSDKIKASRRVFYGQNNNSEDFSLWPKFFLKNVLNPGTDNLREVMQELIQWMDSESFKQLGDLERLGYIEDMSRKLTPFERILFYEAVYYIEPDSADQGFNVSTKRDWGVLYFYNKILFAHGAVHSGSKLLELTFGDDLARRDLPKIKHVHFYAYMKRLVDIYIGNPEKFLIITNDQLLALATYTNEDFLPQSLNFYLVKVGGFLPEYSAPDGLARELQLEYLSQLERGNKLSYDEALKIVSTFSLSRDLPLEQEQYLKQAYKQNYPSPVVSADIQQISRIEMAVDKWNVYFVGKNGEKELFLNDSEEVYIPIYDQIISDIENYISQHNAIGLEKIQQALLRKNTGTLPFWQGMNFRIVVKELMLNAIRAVRESKDLKGKVIVNIKIDNNEFVISFIDNGKILEKEIKPSLIKQDPVENSEWVFNGNGWNLGGMSEIDSLHKLALDKSFKVFEDGFTSKLNEWGENGYGSYYSRLFVEQIIGIDFPADQKPKLVVTDDSYSTEPGALKTFQVIIPLQTNRHPQLETLLKKSSIKILENSFIDHAI